MVDERKDLVDGSRISVAKLGQNVSDQGTTTKWLALGVSNHSKRLVDAWDCDALGNGRAPLADRHHAVPARLPVVIAVQGTAERIEQSGGIERDLQRRIEYERFAGQSLTVLRTGL